MKQIDVIIIGGGPVGLFLAGLLHKKGLSCRILEQRPDIDPHSKSLGIHPVSLELFEKADVIKPFLKKGLKIKQGHAFIDTDHTGIISFEECAKPYNFILSIPQHQTEKILEKWVNDLDPDILVRGASFESFQQDKKSVEAAYTINGGIRKLKAAFLVGCDGKDSLVREQAGINFHGSPYPDTYIMGDFSDTTDFESDAAVYLHHDGLIECFPLPNGMRRWVVKTDAYIKTVNRELIESAVRSRLSHELAGAENSMLSSFGVQHYMAGSANKNRVFIAGDAFHVISPIGGQGMNLGWLDVQHLSGILQSSINEYSSVSGRFRLFQSYSDQRKLIARQVARRAEINMWLGRKRVYPQLRNLLIHLMMKPPANRLMANIFTMRGLGKWWI